jgi:hypothetical protein
MARQLRVEFHDALYHVLSRGNERNPIFKNDSDRQLFIKGEIGEIGVKSFNLTN